MAGDDLTLTSLTIADAREGFEIVIEKQLMVLYAWWKFIVSTSMSEMWAHFGVSFWFSIRTEATVSGELSLVNNSTPEKLAHEELAPEELGPGTVWRGHDPQEHGMELLRFSLS